jgi:hypothetical protein
LRKLKDLFKLAPLMPLLYGEFRLLATLMRPAVACSRIAWGGARTLVGVFIAIATLGALMGNTE